MILMKIISSPPLTLWMCVLGPGHGGGAAPRHLPLPGQHGQEAGQRPRHAGGRHPAAHQARADEPALELPQGQEHRHTVHSNN